jgi:fido (protein-threonine AMPylation protein)
MEKDEKQPQDAENLDNKDKEAEIDWKAEALKQKAMAERRKKRLEKYESKQAKPDKQEKKPDKKEEKQNDIISEENKAYFFAKGGTRTELVFVRKVMKAEECDFDKAWKSDLFRAMKAENDKKIKKRKSQLDPSRGGKAKPEGVKPSNQKEKEFLDTMGVKSK